jgi:hypothetical protein
MPSRHRVLCTVRACAIVPRLVVNTLALAAISAAALTLASAAVGATVASAASPQAGLVVMFGDGTITEMCVDIGAEEVSGLELLRRSGLPVRIDEGAQGATVCRIGPDGCAEGESCWCRCQSAGPDCAYWSYGTLEGGRWQYAEVGAADRTVRDGDVDGWAWTTGVAEEDLALPAVSFDDLCADGPTAPEETSAGGDAGDGAVGPPGSGTYVGYLALAVGLAMLAGVWAWSRRR